LPVGGATFRAPAQLGWGNAMRFLLTAGEFGAAEALRIGLVQEVVPAGSHVGRARELAQLVARQAPFGVQGTLANACMGRSQGPDAAREHFTRLLPSIMRSQDAAEGLRSFTELWGPKTCANWVDALYGRRRLGSPVRHVAAKSWPRRTCDDLRL
jgi:enoyl-CoA hydratase/carnithine racemase